MSWGRPGERVFNSGHPQYGNTDPRTGVDTFGAHATASRPRGHIWTGVGPDSSVRAPVRAYDVPGYGKMDLNPTFGFGLDGIKPSGFGAEIAQSRITITNTRMITPKPYECDYTEGMPLFTKSNADLPLTSAIVRGTDIVWSVAEANKYLAEWSHLYRTGQEVANEIRCAGILLNSDSTVSDMRQVNGGVRMPFTIANMLIGGEARAHNHFGGLRGCDKVFVTYRLVPKKSGFNFTLSQGVVQDNSVSFDKNGASSLVDYDYEARMEGEAPAAAAAGDGAAAEVTLPVMYQNRDKDILAKEETHRFYDPARITLRGGAQTGKNQWESYQWEVAFTSHEERSLPKSEITTKVGVVDPFNSNKTLEVEVVGAYQYIGRVRYVLTKEARMTLDPTVRDAALRNHSTESLLPSVTMDVSISPPESFGSNVLITNRTKPSVAP